MWWSDISDDSQVPLHPLDPLDNLNQLEAIQVRGRNLVLERLLHFWSSFQRMDQHISRPHAWPGESFKNDGCWGHGNMLEYDRIFGSSETFMAFLTSAWHLGGFHHVFDRKDGMSNSIQFPMPGRGKVCTPSSFAKQFFRATCHVIPNMSQSFCRIPSWSILSCHAIPGPHGCWGAPNSSAPSGGAPQIVQLPRGQKHSTGPGLREKHIFTLWPSGDRSSTL